MSILLIRHGNPEFPHLAPVESPRSSFLKHGGKGALPNHGCRLATFQIPRSFPWMKINEIRNLLHAQPFRPFLVHVADGGRIAVKHEDFVALAPTRREMFVYQPDGSWQIVDVPLVTRLQVLTKNGGTKAHK